MKELLFTLMYAAFAAVSLNHVELSIEGIIFAALFAYSLLKSIYSFGVFAKGLKDFYSEL